MSLTRQLLHRKLWKKLISLTLIGAMLPGCSGPDKKITYLGDPEPLDYKDHVMEIAHPDVDEPTPDVVAATKRPRKIGDRSRDEIWDLSLAEALHLYLVNNKILRVRGDFGPTPTGATVAGPAGRSNVMANADGVPSVYDPAVRDSGVLFGGRGVEAALSAFDPVFATNMLWGSNSAIQNNLVLFGGLAKGAVLKPD